jgi:hypothetical protein
MMTDRGTDPASYCAAWLEQLKTKHSRRGLNRDDHQLVVVLTHFAQLQPGPGDFESQLRLLVESSIRTHRNSLAAAARSVLANWERSAVPLLAAAT